MSLDLATTLMVCIAVFQAGNGEFGVLPSAEYDSGSRRQFDPLQSRRGDGYAKRRGDPDRISAAATDRLRLYSAMRRGGGGRRARSTLCHGDPP